MSKGPIFWHQGLYLQPHHFQWADRRQEELLGELAAAARPWFWGVRHISLDMGALAGNTLALERFSGIFPGTGIVLELPGNTVCAGRALPQDLVAVGESLLIYAGLRLLRPGEANVTLSDNPASLAAATTRYGLLTGQETVPDLYENAPPAQVRRLNYVLRLVLEPEKEKQSDLVYMPVARIVRGTEHYALDSDYAPPCLSLADSPVLAAVFREVLDRVLGKTRQMDSYKGLSQRPDMGEMTSLFLVLRSLSRFAARLQLAADSRLLAPWEAFLLLRELVAELSVFSREYNPLGEDSSGVSHLLPYDHDNAVPAFLSAKKIIVSILDSLSSGPRHMLRFTPEPPFWTVRLAPHILDDPKGLCEYWLALQSPGANLAAQAESLPKHLKLAAAGQLVTLLAHAVPGLPVSVEENPPLGLSRQAGAVYLRIHHDSPLWSEVKKQGGLSLDWNDAPTDLEAYFIVLGG